MDVDVFALGGVSRENMATLKGIGLAGIAAITLFMRDEPISDILEEVRQL
jgi:thiamine monophosphate synthase